MEKGNKLNLTNILLISLACVFAIDITMKIAPSFSFNPLKKIGLANAEEKKEEVRKQEERSSRAPFYYPPFPISKGSIRFYHVGLMVKDLDKSIDFYCNKLGFKLIRIQDVGFLKMAFISTGDGEPILELEQLMQEVKGMSAEGFSHIGLFVDDVDGIYEASKKKEVKWEGAPGRFGPGAPYMGFMVDPDGYRIEIMENPKTNCKSCHRGPHLN